MDIEITPNPESAIDPAIHVWFERLDGPPLLAFQVHSEHGLAREVDWHHHARGQLICVESGLLTTRTERGDWSLPAGCAGWMPPGERHTVAVSGPIRGWGVLVTPEACTALPGHPCVLGISDLVQCLARRLAAHAPEEMGEPRLQRLAAVLLDELGDAPPQGLHLPMPQDRRLLRIVTRLIADPADEHALDYWAQWAGLSPRSLSRHFRAETGMSFGQWRQQARLAESLRLLHAGQPVGAIAHQLGYSSASAFVTVFARHYGAPPGRYLQRSGRHRPPPRLASPAASG
ncbi:MULTISPECIES: AraC family transcriptional regulator [Gammaproteobacteria]|jgi:AraC-like DNA-binding protein|uniref:Transcriptional regulator n=1 Tax=Xanthomonas boreopolis TaxID=86183 RepID=A0A919F6T7_9XANT|nr:helix-turn-helix transcriptional regulator [Pseudomonas sp. Hp2]GHH51653.1 transcriptional regulator [[Pseudomonas] boreopolis]